MSTQPIMSTIKQWTAMTMSLSFTLHLGCLLFHLHSTDAIQRPQFQQNQPESNGNDLKSQLPFQTGNAVLQDQYYVDKYANHPGGAVYPTPSSAVNQKNENQKNENQKKQLEESVTVDFTSKVGNEKSESLTNINSKANPSDSKIQTSNPTVTSVDSSSNIHPQNDIPEDTLRLLNSEKESSKIMETLQSQQDIEKLKMFEETIPDYERLADYKITEGAGDVIFDDLKRDYESPVTSDDTSSEMKNVMSSVNDFSDDGFKKSDAFKIQYLKSDQDTTQAYLLSPGWGGGENYPPHLKLWERLTLPPGHALHLSVLHLNLLNHPDNVPCNPLTQDVLSVFLFNSWIRTLVFEVCGSKAPPPITLEGQAVEFVLVTQNETFDSGAYAAGFRLWFSIFDPEKIDINSKRSDSSSTSNTNPIKSNSRKGNHKVENSNNKDLDPDTNPDQNSKQRSYTSTSKTNQIQSDSRNESQVDNSKTKDLDKFNLLQNRCKKNAGDGGFVKAGMCLKYLDSSKMNEKKSWNKADHLCKEGGGWLPVLNTPQKWRTMMSFVKEKGEKIPSNSDGSLLYIGLKMDNLSQPRHGPLAMYEGLGRWSDGRTAFYVENVPFLSNRLHCYAFSLTQSPKLLAVGCDSSNIINSTSSNSSSGDSTSNPQQLLCQFSVVEDTQTVSPEFGPKVYSHDNKMLTPTVSPQFGPPSVDKVDKNSKSTEDKFRLVQCPAGHYVHSYLACDVSCYGDRSLEANPNTNWKKRFQETPPKSECPVRMSAPPPLFTCSTGGQRVPFTWVCDVTRHCDDGSDEDFCQFVKCGVSQFACLDQWQCIEQHQKCDGHTHCSDGSDESATFCSSSNNTNNINKNMNSILKLPTLLNTLPLPALVDTNQHGRLTLKRLSDLQIGFDLHDNKMAGEENDFFTCPQQTHFKCSLYCMPVFLRCNGVIDCPVGEDEMSCEEYKCPGYYKCQGYNTDRSLVKSSESDKSGLASPCVSLSNVCDGISHCPNHDDEYLCDLQCPQSCSCQFGHVFTCRGSFPAKHFPGLRFLDAEESGMQLKDLSNNNALVYLNLASCEISSLQDITNPLYNLQTLDLSFNKISTFSFGDLWKFPNLKDLSLRSNPLMVSTPSDSGWGELPALQRLDLSMVWVRELNGEALSRMNLGDLMILNLSFTGLDHVTGSGFQPLKNLGVLDLQGCTMKHFDADIFKDLDHLEEIYGTKPALCCPGVAPQSPDILCSVPEDVSTVCDSLLYSNQYRLVLIIVASLIIAGNVGSFVYRVFINQEEKSHSCGVVVTHLCVSDFLMGVYLVILGLADTGYGSTYPIHQEQWRTSLTCKVAGFFSLLSSEVSAFFICLLTIDRFAALRCPNSRLHFTKISAQLISWMIWFFGVFIASVPLIETHWTFYGQTGTCLPLPTNSQSFDGRDYSFGVLVMLNFTLFLIIAIGQALIFCAVKSKKKTLGVNSDAFSVDRAITKRLIAIAVTDFLCWFPVCLVGFLASDGVQMPRHINTALTVMVLPLNSAINPFIYTFFMIKGNRQQWAQRSLQADKSFMI